MKSIIWFWAWVGIGICWLWAAPLQAQQLPKFDRAQVIGIDQGMPRGTLFDITKDRQGFMWFGIFNTAHRGGLCRYDGTELRVFVHDPADSLSLTSNAITSLLVDRDRDWMWVGTSLGLNRYDPYTETFKAYSQTWSEKIFQDRQGELWVSLRDSVDNSIIGRYEPEADSFQIIHFPEGPIEGTVSFVQDVKDDAVLWIGTFEGLWRFDKESLQFLEHLPQSHPDPNQAVLLNQIDACYQHDNGQLFLSLWTGGISIYHPDKKTYTTIPSQGAGALFQPLNSIFAPDILPHGKNQLWLSNEEGLALYDVEKKAIVKSWINENDRFFRVKYIDEAGGFWVKTLHSRVVYYHPDLNQMEQIYLPGLLRDDEIFYNILMSSERNRLLINTNNSKGLIWYDPLSKESGRYMPTGLERRIRVVDISTQQRVIALGTDQLWQLEPRSNRLVPFRTVPNIPATMIQSILTDQHGDLWVSLEYQGLTYLDGQKGRVKKKYEFERGHNTMFYLFEDSKGRIWVSLVYGYGVLEPGAAEFSFYYSLTDHITGYWEDADGMIWMAVLGKGIGWVDPQQPQEGFQGFLTTQDGLLSNSVYDMEADFRGKLWVSTDQGLNVIDPLTKSILGAIKLDKIKYEGYMQPSFLSLCNLPDGRMALSYVDKLFLFDPEALQQSQQQARPYISKLLVANQPVSSDTVILFRNEVSLSHDQVPLTLQFSAFQYGSVSQPVFQYRLKGVDQEWVDAGKDRSVTYSNLPYGEHIFEVRVGEVAGKWQEELAHLKIVVSPPWWRSPWAYGAYVLTLLMAIYFFLQWRTFSLRRQRQLLRTRVAEQTQELQTAKQAAEAANEAKSTFLSTVSHELRTPLTSIIGFTKLNKKNLEGKVIPVIGEEEVKAQKAASRISKNLDVVSSEGERLTSLINELLDLAKIESGKVDWKMEQLNPAELIERAVNATSALFTEKPGLELITDIPDDLPTIIGDSDRLLQVLINLISNAVKFTDSGEVKIGVNIPRLNSPPLQRGAHEAGEVCEAPFEGARPGLDPGAAASASGDVLFSVKDTGSGIPADQLDKVFERFQQVEDNQVGKPKGTGLGLPICKEIVEHHGGRIWGESEMGKGSAFFVRLFIKHVK